MQIKATGGSWISSKGYGLLNSSRSAKPEFDNGQPVSAPSEEFTSLPLKRYGRLDAYTKLGFAAVGLTLVDAKVQQNNEKQAIGIIISTKCGCMDNDSAYYETTLEKDGLFASPNMFSYTLPGIVLGECAAHFKLTGPTFCVGEENALGSNALTTAKLLLGAGAAKKIIVGALNCSKSKASANGAAFVMLEASETDEQTEIDCSDKNSIWDFF